MDKYNRRFIAVILFSISVVLFLMNLQVAKLKNGMEQMTARIVALEQINEVKEIVSRGYGTGIGIGSPTFTENTVYIDIPISHTHTSDPLSFPRNPMRLFCR